MPSPLASPFRRTAMRAQKPPVRLYVPPVIAFDASGCPIVAPSEYVPPVENVAPPPAMTLEEIVYAPPLWARARPGSARAERTAIAERMREVLIESSSLPWRTARESLQRGGIPGLEGAPRACAAVPRLARVPRAPASGRSRGLARGRGSRPTASRRARNRHARGRGE